MEKLNETKKETKEETKYLGGTSYQYAEDAVKLDMKEAKDVTNDIIGRIGKSYQESVKTIKQIGRYYLVEMSEGFTSLGQKTRIARRVPEIGFIARCATEEKNGKGYNDYVAEFKKNNIAFDGVHIPQFIDTKEDVAKIKEKESVKSEKEKAKKEKDTNVESK